MNVNSLMEVITALSQPFEVAAERHIAVAAAACDADPEEVMNREYADVIDEYKRAIATVNSKQKPKNSIICDFQILELIPFTQLTLGAFIDLETYCSDPSKLPEVIGVLYRLYEQETSLHPKKYEEYDNWMNERVPFIRLLLAEDVIGARAEYLNWRDQLLMQYSGLFQAESSAEEEEEVKTVGIAARRQDTQERNARAFAWESALLTLTNGDATRFTQALDMPVILAMNALSAIKNN